MLEPWLGAEIATLDLPMPVLIDATVGRGHAIDIEALSTRLMAVAPGTVVDEHAVSASPPDGPCRHSRDGFVVSDGVSIVFGCYDSRIHDTDRSRDSQRCRGGIAPDRGKGPHIARQFQIHNLWLAGIGAACGSVLGGAAILLIEGYGARLSNGLLPDITLGGIQWGPALPATGCGGSSSRRDRRNYGQTRSGKNDVKHRRFAAACRSCCYLSWPCRWVFCLGGSVFTYLHS